MVFSKLLLLFCFEADTNAFFVAACSAVFFVQPHIRFRFENAITLLSGSARVSHRDARANMERFYIRHGHSGRIIMI